MVHDIHDSKYASPLKTLQPYKQVRKSESDKVGDILWWIFFVLSCILLFVYVIGVYFTYFDDPDEFLKTFNNKRIYAKFG